MVKIAAVIDSACLIGLERIGRLDLLPALIEPVMVPPAVEVVGKFNGQAINNFRVERFPAASR